MKSEKVPGWEITFKGTFSFDDLYKFLHLYLDEKGWVAPTGGSDAHEILYHEKHNGGVREHWIYWRYVKNSENKIINYSLNIDFRTIAITQVEIMVNGKKTKAWKGELTIGVNPKVNIKYDEELDKINIIRLFKYLVYKKHYHKNVDQHVERLNREILELQSTIKRYWQLFEYLPNKKQGFFSNVRY